MKIPVWLLTILDPSELQNLKMDELSAALNDASIRKHWIWSVLEEMKLSNRKIHSYLMDGDLPKKFGQESGRLQGLDWALRQILNSKSSVELERHNRVKDELDGIDVDALRP